MRVIDLDHTTSSVERLTAFYAGLYTSEFPDENERELLENMIHYLSLRADGWYGLNNYHILLLENETGNIIGGIIADYLARSNIGMIEFVVVDHSLRRAGLGKRLLEECEARLQRDAVRAGNTGLRGIAAEVDDPYQLHDTNEHLDSFDRMRIWSKLGYSLLDFPYVQPALSENLSPVKGLKLMFKPIATEIDNHIPSLWVHDLVADYQIWAMRIPNPEQHPVFAIMATHLASKSNVALLDMREYIGDKIR